MMCPISLPVDCKYPVKGVGLLQSVNLIISLNIGCSRHDVAYKNCLVWRIATMTHSIKRVQFI